MKENNQIRGNVGMRIAICDDFKPFRDSMSKNAKSYDEKIEMDVFEDGKYLLENFAAGKYDIIILDYYMNEIGGLQASMEIRKIDQKVIIILATTEAGVDMCAGDVYLKLEKPIPQDRFNRAMEACIQRAEKNEEYVEFRSEGIKRIVKKKNICFISDTGKVVMERFRMDSDERVDFSEEPGFFITKSGNQIRIDKIEEISGKTVRMRSGDEIKLGFREYKELRMIRHTEKLS